MATSQFYDATISAVKNKKDNVTAIDASVRRILEAKFKLGLFEDPRHVDAGKAHARQNRPFAREQAA
jgi:beta-glucosidase